MASDKTQILQSGTKDTVQHALAYDGSKHRLFSAGSDGMVRLWNTDTYQELQSWRAANEPITVLHCAPSGRQLLIGNPKWNHLGAGYRQRQSRINIVAAHHRQRSGDGRFDYRGW